MVTLTENSWGGMAGESLEAGTSRSNQRTGVCHGAVQPVVGVSWWCVLAIIHYHTPQRKLQFGMDMNELERCKLNHVDFFCIFWCKQQSSVSALLDLFRVDQTALTYRHRSSFSPLMSGYIRHSLRGRNAILQGCPRESRSTDSPYKILLYNSQRHRIRMANFTFTSTHQLSKATSA